MEKIRRNYPDIAPAGPTYNRAIRSGHWLFISGCTARGTPAQGKCDIPAIPSGGVNFVDVRDVAATFFSAMRNGTPGERYLLGGPNWTLERFFGHLERISKVDAPRFHVGKKLHTVASKLIEGIYDSLGKTPPSAWRWPDTSGTATRARQDVNSALLPAIPTRPCMIRSNFSANAFWAQVCSTSCSKSTPKRALRLTPYLVEGLTPDYRKK